MLGIRIVLFLILSVKQIKDSIFVVVWVPMEKWIFGIDEELIQSHNSTIGSIFREIDKVVVLFVNGDDIELLFLVLVQRRLAIV